MKQLFYLIILGLGLITFENQAQAVTDYDGNVYETVTIGNQVWMKQNLKVTHYNNGVPIPNITENTEWDNLTTGARRYYNNDSTTNNPLYGALYNWYVINDTNNICPKGWHIPTNQEWIEVENFLGGSGIAGGMMKEAGTSHWKSPNTDATNSTGFTGLPGGTYDYTKKQFAYIGENGFWWTATDANNPTFAWSTYMWYLFAGVDHNPTPKKYGLSIRCVQDVGTGLNDNNYQEEIKIYPNPSVDNYRLEYFIPDSKYVVIEMLDILGRKISSISSSIENGHQIKNINCNDIAPGVYFIKMVIGSDIKILKVIK